MEVIKGGNRRLSSRQEPKPNQKEHKKPPEAAAREASQLGKRSSGLKASKDCSGELR